MPGSRPPTVRSAPLAFLLAAALACGSESSDPPQCRTGGDCPAPPSACLFYFCDVDVCRTALVAAGTVVGGDATGNCRASVCDGAGAVTSAPDDADVPSDGDACTADLCAAGVASHAALDAGTPCAQDGGSRCDGGGACVQCLAPSDCPGSDTECAARTCTGGICGVTAAPFGTPLAAQVAGDCRQAVCDGLGGTTTATLDTDAPADDGNACTADFCMGGVALHPPLDAGTACVGANGGVVCDGAGACVECLAAAACPGQDGECQFRTCVAGRCGVAFVPTGSPIAAQTAGDCREDVCDGAGAIASVALPTDVPSNPPAPAGTACGGNGGVVCDGAGACVACNVGADCASGVCAAHACQAPTCTDLVKNGGETGVDCGGGTCPACADGAGCAAASDCTSGVCVANRCRAPSCGDGVKNGRETDVDCGGGSCPACVLDRSCLADPDCFSGNCRDRTCGGPLVTGVTPSDGAADVPPATAITVFFGQQVIQSTVTSQAATGPCSGSVQISADGFSTCLGISSKSVSTSSATLQPAAPLARGTAYRIRTTTALFATGIGAFEPFETPAGFTTAGGGACGGSLVISQIYAHGGFTLAAYARDFIELHNDGDVPARLDGMSVQYATPTSGLWAVTPLSGTIPAGGYYLVQGGGITGGPGAPLPAPDATGTIDLSPAGGKVALVSTTSPLSGSTSCPTVGVLDLVGYGASGTTPTACREGAAPAPAIPDAAGALARAGAGCADGNGNALDLGLQLAVPRSSVSAPFVCGCNGTAVNGTGFFVEMDLCNVQSPIGLTVAAGAPAGPVLGRVLETGITDPFGPPPALTAELGYGPTGTDPRWAAGWTFVPATWNAQVGNDDEFSAFFTAPAAGSWVYAYRVSPDGRQWTYCDPNGAGSSPGNPFEPNSLPSLTVTAP